MGAYIISSRIKTMKKYFIYLVFGLLISLSSCKKRICGFDESQPIYLGKWKWVETSGGFAGSIETPASTGKEIYYEFLQNGSYIKTVNDIIIEEGKFQISTQNCIHQNRVMPTIQFESQTELTIETNNTNTLYLADENADGFTYKYTK